MAFKIFWSSRAIQDLGEIVEFVAQDNLAAAERLGLGIMGKVRPLENYPLIGRVVPERKDTGFREVFHGPYRIVYRVKNAPKEVEVVRIWHAAQGDPEI